MAASLEKLLKGSSSRFTNNYLTPCMAHVLNLAVQRGLKELGNEESYSDSEDDDKDIEGLEAISQKQFGEILHRLRKLVTAINSSPKRIHCYKNLCDELEMSNKNILIEDVQTRWNSTYHMIKAAWEKREVLKVMASDHLNTNKVNFLIEDEERELLKMFADELLAFREATQVFSKSKSITSTVGQSWSRSDLWDTIRSKSRSRSRSGLGPPRSRSGSVLTSVSLDHEYAYLKRDKCINVH